VPEARLFVAPARKVCPGGVERLDLKGKAEAMEARIHVITLAVADLERALAFYRDGLGLHTPGVVGSEHVGDDTTAAGAVAMFELDDGLILALYPRGELAKDAEIPRQEGQSGEFSLGQLVSSRAEVDALLTEAEAAGATVSRARDRPWGIYSGYFRDPDGHLWEVIHNPRESDAGA
jgi:catechol 2,3-dioxygenase-like lactoylglutathione lyase family enzyme